MVTLSGEVKGDSCCLFVDWRLLQPVVAFVLCQVTSVSSGMYVEEYSEAQLR
jgi:hypothetical protein